MTRDQGQSVNRDAAIYLAASIVSSAVPFLLMPFLTRWLGPSEFGIVGSYVALNGVLAAFIGLSTHGLVSVVYYRDGPNQMPAQMGAAIGICAAGTFVCLLSVWIGREFVSKLTSIPSLWLQATVFSAAAQFLTTLALAAFQTLRRPGLYALIQFGYSSVLALITIWLVGVMAAGWEGRVIAQLTAAVLLACIGLITLTRMHQIAWSPTLWPIGKTVAFGLPLLPHALSAIIMSNVDRFVLNAKVGSEAVGQYFAAAQIALLLVVIATAFNQAWLPRLYKHLANQSQASDRIVAKTTLSIFLTLFTAGMTISLLARFIIPVVAGPGYEDAIPVLQILGPTAACSASYLFVASFLFYHERTTLLSVLTASAAVLQVILSLSLGAKWGMLGVAIAAATSAVYYWLATWIAANSIHPLPWRSIWSED